MKTGLRRGWSTIRDDGRGWILLAVSLGWLLTIGVRIVYPALLPDVREEFPIGYTTAGLLVGTIWAAYGLAQLPGGLLADAVSERVALVGGMVVTGAGLVALVGAPTLGVFVAATAIAGVGTGIFGPSRVTVLSRTFPDRRSTAIGISQAAGNVGNALLPVVAGLLTAAFGWRAGFGYLLPPIVVVALGLWAVLPGKRVRASSSIAELLARTRRELRGPPVLYGTALLLGIMLVYQSLTGFLPTFLVDEKALSTTVATTLFGGFFAAAVVVQFVAGVVADRRGIAPTIALFALASVPGVGLLVLGEGLPALVVGVALSSCLLGCFPPAHAYTVAVVPDEVEGTGYGLVRTVYIGGGALGPVAVGLVADAATIGVALGGLVALVVAIAALARALPVVDG